MHVVAVCRGAGRHLGHTLVQVAEVEGFLVRRGLAHTLLVAVVREGNGTRTLRDHLRQIEGGVDERRARARHPVAGGLVTVAEARGLVLRLQRVGSALEVQPRVVVVPIE
jgi:hypothetical protein